MSKTNEHGWRRKALHRRARRLGRFHIGTLEDVGRRLKVSTTTVWGWSRPGYSNGKKLDRFWAVLDKIEAELDKVGTK